MTARSPMSTEQKIAKAAYDRIYHAAHPVKDKVARRIYERAWRDSHPRTEHDREYQREWCRRNPAKRQAYQQARRAREVRAGGGFTADEWNGVLAKFEYRCAYCGSAASALEADHVIPLSRGGTNDISNILPACRTCNRRKHVKTAEEFLRRVASR